MSIVLQPLKAAIHGGFFELVLMPRVFLYQLGDFVAVPIALGQELEDNGVGVATQQVGSKFVIYHNYNVHHTTMSVKVIQHSYIFVMISA